MTRRKQCQQCGRRLKCDWDKPPGNPCADFRHDPHKDVPVLPADEKGFEAIRGKMCVVKFPHGRRFKGRPVAFEPNDFILVQTGDEEFVAVEFGAGAEIHVLED